eukprot:EG_transcript_22202
MSDSDIQRHGPFIDITNKLCSSSLKISRWSPSTPSTSKLQEMKDNKPMPVATGSSATKFLIAAGSVSRGNSSEPSADRPSARCPAPAQHLPDVDYPSTLEQACQMIDQQREDIVKTLEVGQELLCRLADVQGEFDQLTDQLHSARHNNEMLEHENRILKNRLFNTTEARGQNIYLQEQLQEAELLLQKEQDERLQKSLQDRLDRERQEMSCLNSLCQSPGPTDAACGDRLSLLEHKYLAQLKENSCLRDQLQGLSDLQDLLREKDEWIQTLQNRLTSHAPPDTARTVQKEP